MDLRTTGFGGGLAVAALLFANTVDAFVFSNIMNPSTWTGGHDNDYYDDYYYDDVFAGPGYSYSGFAGLPGHAYAGYGSSSPYSTYDYVYPAYGVSAHAYGVSSYSSPENDIRDEEIRQLKERIRRLEKASEPEPLPAYVGNTGFTSSFAYSGQHVFSEAQQPSVGQQVNPASQQYTALQLVFPNAPQSTGREFVYHQVPRADTNQTHYRTFQPTPALPSYRFK